MSCRSKSAWGSFLAAAALFCSSGAAAVTQPNGVTVPTLAAGVTTCTDKNVEVCIDGAEGDAALIATQADALVAPETFQPTCQLTFKPIVKGGSIWDVFGWYNVKEDASGKPVKPLPNELYGMFVTNGFKTGEQLVGQEVVLDLSVEAEAGRYKGGQIGFFVVSGGGEIRVNPTTRALQDGSGVPLSPQFQFFTQHALNPGSTAGSTYYNVLTWESVAHKNTFYFGWEDLPATGGEIDHDFDDFVFSVSGVQCGGGGQPCETGNSGVCAAGVLQCKKSVITCVQTLQASDELCNALDDDCNGAVDDGDALCGAAEVCDRGVCVPRCGTGEFRCPGDTVCTSSGVCVDAACKEVECEAGKVCQEGKCVDSCTGIVCPHERVCRNGGCVDPCVGIECDEGFACVLGICTSCECSTCGAGLVCRDSQCVDSGCDTQTCAEGTHCSMGACVDDCDGSVCPQGQTCSGGECVADGTSSGGGVSGGGNGIGGTLNLGGSSSVSGGNAGGGRRAQPLDISEPACGCVVPGRADTARGAWLWLAVGGLLLLSRRARRDA